MIEESMDKKELIPEFIERKELLDVLDIINRELKKTKKERDTLVKQNKSMELSIKKLEGQLNDGLKETISEEQLNVVSFGMSEKRHLLQTSIEKIKNVLRGYKVRIEEMGAQTKAQFRENIELIKQNQKKVQEISVNIENFTTKNSIIDSKTMAASEVFEFIDTKGEGIIKQLQLEANTSSFSVRILIDDEIFADKTYTYFNTHSDNIVNMSAFLESAVYYLSLRNIQFQRKVQITITTSAATTFSHIFCNYDIRKERKVIG